MKFAISILFMLLLMTPATLFDPFPDAHAIIEIVQKYKDSKVSNDENIVKMNLSPKNLDNSVLIEDTYLVEFDQSASVRNFQQTIVNSLQRSYGIPRSTITMRQIISSSLFSGASFSVNTKHSIEAIESIPGAIAIYPIYFVPGPESLENDIPPGRTSNNRIDSVIAHKLTGVDQVHDKLKNFGKGVRVAVLDSGIDYFHPALGGCFGPDCKVAFGYDFVGDRYGGSYHIPMPDNDPLDNCSRRSHGTHVAGILAANGTEITQIDYIPVEPFLGVAPQATIGAYRIFGCPANGTSTDIITAAIYRAFEDKADIITLSVGSAGAYAERSDAIAAKRVSDAGVYVLASMGNDGVEGLQTGSNPAISTSVIAVASVDNSYAAQLYLTTPDSETIFYSPGVAFGGWRATVNSIVVINDPQAAASDGCSGPSKPVSGAVVLYAFSTADTCNSAVRCDKAAAAGATGCLLYNVGSITGSTSIPSGSISLDDGRKIIAIVTENPSAMFTFTNLLGFTSTPTVGTPALRTSLGLTGDLLFKPQISGIGGYVYSTISSYAAQSQNLAKAYASYSGTSMACPYVAGTLALFLAQIGNPAPETVGNDLNDGNRRPSFSEVVNLFQSNANPINIYNSTLLASTVQQGAGLVNAFQALTATTIVSPSELALNDTVRQKKSYTIKVANIGKKPASYKICHRGAALATGAQEGNDQLLSTPLYSADYADVHIWPRHFKLHPGQSRTVTLQFRPPREANSNFLPIYSGFIYVTNECDEKVAHISYAGVVGNYSDARILVRNNSEGFISGILDNDGYYITDGQELNVTAAGVFPIVRVTAWASRIVFVEVVSGKDNVLPGFNPSFGLLSDSRERGPLYFTNVLRNGATGLGQTYREYSLYLWSGMVSRVVTIQSSSVLSTTKLSPGHYKLRFSALKHFGDYTNSNDFEVYYTPSFNLVY